MDGIPIVGLIGQTGLQFSCRSLGDRLAFGDSDPEETWEAFFKTFWQDAAVDQIPAVMAELEQEGVIQSARTSDDPLGPVTLSPAQHNLIQERLRKYRLPEIECYLADSWDFTSIAVNARRRLGHVNPDPSKSFMNRLLAAALDLEVALRKRHPHLTGTDIYHFWSGLQTHKHLAEFCRKYLWD